MSDNIERALGNVEGRMAGVESQLAALTSAITSRQERDDTRISNLEKRVNRYAGGLAVLVFLLPAAAKAFGLL